MKPLSIDSTPPKRSKGARLGARPWDLKHWLLALAFIWVLLGGVLLWMNGAWAQEAGDALAPANALGALQAIIAAFRSGQYAVGAGLLLTLLVAVFRWFELGRRVPKRWVPWLTAGLAVVGAVAVGLQTGQSWWDMLISGFGVGLTAVGGWETIGKALQALLIRPQPSNDRIHL